MSNNNQIIPVPLGGGLDRSPHSWLVQPPKAAQVQNMDLVAGGAYRKRSGFERVAVMSDGKILLPQHSALGVLGQDGLSILNDAVFETQTFGAAFPTAVETKPVYSFRGAVSGAQIAYNGGYVGVALTEVDAEAGRRAVVFIVDATTWTISSGPYTLPELAHGVRVEPVEGSNFLFLGVDIPSDTRTSSSLVGTLYVAPLGPGDEAPTPILVSQLVATNTDELNLLYDSHGIAGGSYAYICLTGGDFKLYALSIDASGSATSSEVAASSGNAGIWYASAVDTVLVYNSADSKLYYSDGKFNSAWSSIAAPISGLPMFHQRASGGSEHVWLSDRRVTILGNGPGTPSVTASDGLTPTLHRRPQPRSQDGAWFFQRYTAEETENYGDRLLAGGEQITAEALAPLPGSGSSAYFERHVVPLGQGRAPLWYMDHFHAYYWYDTGDGTTKRAVYGVHGQSAQDGTTLYVPQLVANSAYLAPPLQRAYGVRNRYPVLLTTPTNSSVSGSDIASADEANFGRSIESDGAGGYSRTNDIAHRTGGAGVDVGVLQLVVNRVDTASSAASVVDLFGSLVVAAGGLSVFDGSISLPAVLEPPVLVDITTDYTQPDVYLDGATLSTIAAEEFTIDDGQSVSFRGVLFTVDRNGVKYRSDSFSMGYIENSEGRSVIYAPRWTLTLAKSHQNLLFAGRKLGVEIYVSQEYAVADPPADEPGSHTFALRAAVQYDPADGSFFASGAALWDWDDDRTPRSLFDFNPTALYTETELGPQLPPASNVMVHAGNYLFLLSSEDPWVVWHSKPISAKIGPEFHSELTIQLPAESGGVVSLAGESDRLLLLCRNGVYELFVAGSGPDAEGTGDFPPLRKVYGGEGCLTHACTVSGPFGTFFVSESGPKIVTRDGNLVDMGRTLGVDATTFTHATYSSLTREIWLSRGDDGYILDTTRGEWTYTDLPLTATTVWNNVLYRVADGLLLRADSSAVQDGDTSYQAKYVSPWLTLTGALGFVRVRKVAVLIQPLVSGNGRIRISLAYDYVDTDIDTFVYDFSTAEGFDKPIQVWVRPTRQKLDALRITVEDISEG